MTVTVGGIIFHAYGFIIGVALLMGYTMSTWRARQLGISSRTWETALAIAALGALVGARVYHGITDWYLYQSHPISLLFIWEGGLSIIGAVGGGVIALVSWWRHVGSRVQLGQILDALTLGLPVAQAVGRLGNWVNQELYGLPTRLPWGIPIAPEHRVAPYQSAEIFHPLFAYEGGLLLLFWLGYLWVVHTRRTYVLFGISLGYQTMPGVWFTAYLFYYSVIRFLLDFIRIDKSPLFGTIMSKNQLVVALTAGIAILLLQQYKNRKKQLV